MSKSRLTLAVSFLSIFALGGCDNKGENDGNTGTKSAIDTFEYKHDPNKYKNKAEKVTTTPAEADTRSIGKALPKNGNAGIESAIDTFEYKHDPNKYKNPPSAVKANASSAKSATDSAAGATTASSKNAKD
ncbi:hypothetical protein [Massilia pseudoviolaceinigra]|uniref:hypothetical protein n=1 Tax=Massilia pseudoviolaceinigra TaxID=3057165 RepID=UPI002796DE0D|nr:hypothetical protein [Massilia sp. CCM 9206]MDQ1922680.1 hypothetical protein [Massilia sp. CCM 9206]